eukprot:2355994-Rhodomonas_salina.1
MSEPLPARARASSSLAGIGQDCNLNEPLVTISAGGIVRRERLGVCASVGLRLASAELEASPGSFRLPALLSRLAPAAPRPEPERHGIRLFASSSRGGSATSSRMSWSRPPRFEIGVPGWLRLCGADSMPLNDMPPRFAIGDPGWLPFAANNMS